MCVLRHPVSPFPFFSITALQGTNKSADVFLPLSVCLFLFYATWNVKPFSCLLLDSFCGQWAAFSFMLTLSPPGDESIAAPVGAQIFPWKRIYNESSVPYFLLPVGVTCCLLLTRSEAVTFWPSMESWTQDKCLVFHLHWHVLVRSIRGINTVILNQRWTPVLNLGYIEIADSNFLQWGGLIKPKA